MVSVKPVLDQVNLVVSDMDRSVVFYRLLGLAMGEPTDMHASMTFPGGFRFALDQHEFARQWNSGSPEPSGGSVVLSLSVAGRDDVDVLWKRMVDAGYLWRQRPYDTFWGCRFAIVADPDGYQIGLMSPRDDDRRYWPPADAPAGP